MAAFSMRTIVDSSSAVSVAMHARWSGCLGTDHEIPYVGRSRLQPLAYFQDNGPVRSSLLISAQFGREEAGRLSRLPRRSSELMKSVPASHGSGQ